MITFQDYDGKYRCCYCFKELAPNETCDCETGKIAADANKEYSHILNSWWNSGIKERRKDPDYKEKAKAQHEKLMESMNKIPKFDIDKVVEYMQNPDRKTKMTEENIKELQQILVQTCIDYINSHHISDLEEVHFNADSLQCSANYNEWTPDTDSAITCYGLKLVGSPNPIGERYEIGSWC